MAVEEIIRTPVTKRHRKESTLFIDTVLTMFSAVLLSLAFPGLLNDKGMPVAAFLFFIPLVSVLKRSSWPVCILFGWIHAYVSYGLFNYWLADFHPLTIIIVPLVYVCYYTVLFPFLKAAALLFPRSGFLLQALIWTGYEFLKSKGFLGYTYGTVGSVFYRWPVLVRASSLTGLWGLSFLALSVGAWVGNFLYNRKRAAPDSPGISKLNRIFGLGIAGYALVLLLYGVFSIVDYGNSPRIAIALTQHNADSWQGGYAAYKENYMQLKALSLEAQEQADPDLIVWPETAFVPTIYYHKTYRRNLSSLSLVEDLENFLASQAVPYLIGNDDARKEPSQPGGDLERVDYNAALLYRDGDWKDLYRKRHLVPFTEYFPYDEQFPRVYQMLLDADTHFWKRGDAFKLIDFGGYKAGTPICFEDTFGYISRAFVRQGADLLINLSNDAWSGSVVAERQHFMLSVFRAGENRRTFVRSTNSGITAWIDPNGVIREELPPFTIGVLNADVPLYSDTVTPYTRWGDWFAWACLLASCGGIFLGILRRLTIPVRSRRIEDKYTQGDLYDI